MKITDIIIIILTIISLITAGGYLFNDSPTFEQALLIFILTLLFANSLKVSKRDTKLNSLGKSFSYLSKDFKEHIKHK